MLTQLSRPANVICSPFIVTKASVRCCNIERNCQNGIWRLGSYVFNRCHHLFPWFLRIQQMSPFVSLVTKYSTDVAICFLLFNYILVVALQIVMTDLAENASLNAVFHIRQWVYASLLFPCFFIMTSFTHRISGIQFFGSFLEFTGCVKMSNIFLSVVVSLES